MRFSFGHGARFGGILIIHQKGEPLIFQEEMSDQVETLTYYIG
jgi:hypothetical protein